MKHHVEAGTIREVNRLSQAAKNVVSNVASVGFVSLHGTSEIKLEGARLLDESPNLSRRGLRRFYESMDLPEFTFYTHPISAGGIILSRQRDRDIKVTEVGTAKTEFQPGRGIAKLVFPGETVKQVDICYQFPHARGTEDIQSVSVITNGNVKKETQGITDRPPYGGYNNDSEYIERTARRTMVRLIFAGFAAEALLNTHGIDIDTSNIEELEQQLEDVSPHAIVLEPRIAVLLPTTGLKRD